MSEKSVKTQSVNIRRTLIKQRFGNIPETTLTKQQDMPEMKFIDINKSFEHKGNKITFSKINVNKHSERIAEIYRNAIDEMIGAKHYTWHHSAELIEKYVAGGDWAFYGFFSNGELVSVTSMFIHRSMYYIQWVWGCVDPKHRGLGLWKYIGEFLDEVSEKSGAVYGRVWCATTHDLSQKTAEKVGYTPHSVDLEYLGGSDGLAYFQPVIFLMKIYDYKNVLPKSCMQLTEKAKKLVDVCDAIK